MTTVSISGSGSLPADNCSRIDSVKAAETQLKLQKLRLKDDTRHAAEGKQASASILAVEDAVRTGDSRKAEAALSAARAIVNKESAAPTPPRSSPYSSADAGVPSLGFSVWA